MKKKSFKLGPLQKQFLHNLKNYPERQMTGRLGKLNPNGSYGACCLGEYGIITGICVWVNEFLTNINGGAGTLYKGYEKVGLYSATGAHRDQGRRSLAALNDNKKTWPEIAAIIEEDPSAYFTKSL